VVLALAGFLLGFPGLAQAGDNDKSDSDRSEVTKADSSKDTTKDSSSDSPHPVSPQPLQGGVRGAALLTKDGLKKIGDTTRDLKRDTYLLMGEITRKEMVQVRGPNVLPGGVVIPPVPNPSGMAPAGPLPARKKQMRMFMSAINYDVQLLNNEIAALIVPDDLSADLAARWQQVRQAMSRLALHYNALREFTSEPPFDNKKIGAEVIAVHDLSKHINKLTKELASSFAEKDSSK
jgi:hypothetical protein